MATLFAVDDAHLCGPHPTTEMVKHVNTRVLDVVSRENQTERYITDAVDAATRDGERPSYTFLSFLNLDRRAFVTTSIDAVSARTPEAVYVWNALKEED